MAKPIHGHPQEDKDVQELTSTVTNTVTTRKLKNCDLKTLKDIQRAFRHALAEIDYAVNERFEQSIGGLKSANRVRARKEKHQQGELQ